MSTSTPAAKLQQILPELFQAKRTSGEPYLRFQLTSEITALVSMKNVQESLLVAAEKITPLPNMPESFIGIVKSRNHVFSIIDLAQMLKLSSTPLSTRQYHTIVLQTWSALSQQTSLIGMAVNRIQGITRFTEEQLASPLEDFPASLTPYLHGCVDEGEKRILVLSAEEIATASPLLSSHSVIT